jgi:hypothetical protein
MDGRVGLRALRSLIPIAALLAVVSAALLAGSSLAKKPVKPPVNDALPSLAYRLPPPSPGAVICWKGTWKNDPKSFSYEWLRDGAPVPGETGVEHKVTPEDRGHKLSCRVTAKNAAGSASATSDERALGDPAGEPGAFPDHFKCYRVVRQRNMATLRYVSLEDQFLSGDRVQVERPQWLCNPVAKNNERPRHPFAHLVCYRSIQPGLAQRTVRIDNQFGSQIATATNTETLCVPSLKRLRAGPGPPASVQNPTGRRKAPSGTSPAGVLDHYRCYRVIPERPQVGQVVTLADQFGFTNAFVGRLVQLCNPVNKNHEGIKEPRAHLACYLIKDALIPRYILGNFIGRIKRTVAWDVVTQNQFGIDELTVYEAVVGLTDPRLGPVPGAEMLCVPSLKTELGDGFTVTVTGSYAWPRNPSPGAPPPANNCVDVSTSPPQPGATGTVTKQGPNNYNQSKPITLDASGKARVIFQVPFPGGNYSLSASITSGGTTAQGTASEQVNQPPPFSTGDPPCPPPY